MIWDTAFNLANLWAMAGWLALIVMPRRAWTPASILIVGVGLLSLAYALGLLLILGGVVDPVVRGTDTGGGSFSSIAGVRAIFASDGGVTIGWIHYLAFDLFAGLWIARDADRRGFSRLGQAPILLLTFFAGPIGFLSWLAARLFLAAPEAGVHKP